MKKFNYYPTGFNISEFLYMQNSNTTRSGYLSQNFNKIFFLYYLRIQVKGLSQFINFLKLLKLNNSFSCSFYSTISIQYRRLQRSLDIVKFCSHISRHRSYMVGINQR